MFSSVEQIKQRLDIVDVITSYVKLQKAGENYKACCPFHNEKTPSFYVSPGRGIWHCFGGCGKGGDIFTFIMEIEKCDFPEALKILAQRAGVELKKEDPRIRSERNHLLNLLEDAKNFYKKNLAAHEKVLEYLLKERGLAPETIENFELGYAPDGWKNVYDFLQNKGYSAQEIEKAGLIIKIQHPTSNIQHPYYDRFRNRIIFPINDSSGRTVAFGGRVFELGVRSLNSAIAPAKYINSPQTVIYDKSHILYGFDKAKKEISKENYCVLVEGYMDALMSHQAGAKNTVAISGVALTPEHLNLISRLTKCIITGFDADEAGHSATGRSVELLLSRGFDVKIINLKEQKDPADLIKKDANLWKEILQKAAPIIAFYLDILEKKYGGDKRQLIFQTEQIVFPYLVRLVNEMEKSFWIKQIVGTTGVKEEAIWEQLKKTRSVYREFPSVNQDLTLKKQSRNEQLEKRIVGVLALARSKKNLEDKLPEIINNNLDLFSPNYRECINILAGTRLNGEKISMENLPVVNYQTLALEAELIYNCETSEEIESELRSLIQNLKNETIKRNLQSLALAIKKISETDKNNPILLQKIEELNKFSKALNNSR